MRIGPLDRVCLRPALALLLFLCSCSSGPQRPGLPRPPLDPATLQLVERKQISRRVEQLTFTTPALDGPTHVDVILPDLYAAEPDRRYPVVYLLQGAIDDFTAWIAEGNAEALSAGYPYILVLPDAGNEGYYSDWYNDGAWGPPQWETYHIRQLLPWIDAHYRTKAERGQRAVAGVSMGGFGALSYAARHPDLFAAATSYSGMVDINFASDRISTPDSVFGQPGEQDIRWRGHNPWDLAGNLHGVDVMLYSRNGLPSRHWMHLDPAEIIVHMQNVSLHKRLLAAGVPHQWHDIGSGPHKWPIWQDDLADTLLQLLKVFADPPPAPDKVWYTAIEPDYTVFGWHVVLQRGVTEFSTLADADRGGFSLSGSGGGTVTTPSLYAPGTRVSATLQSATATQRLELQAGADGRLAVPLTLGPANRYQARTDAAEQDGGTKVYTTTVRFEPAGRR